MASSNRHWPSMFKSKPCNNQQLLSSQNHDNNISHHDSSLLSNTCGRSSGGDERSLEPKPRWNPKPEQIRILESIFNSGLVNPPRDEIRRIRTQLQEYGQVGDANVFYWFQNRKTRSKHKQRTLQSKTATSSSSSNSSRFMTKSGTTTSNNNSSKINNNINNNVLGVDDNFNFGNSHNSINNYFHQFVSQEPIFFPLQQSGVSVVGNNFSQGLCYPNYNNNSNNNINEKGNGNGNGNSHNDLMMNGGDPTHVSPPTDQTGGGFLSLFQGDIFNGGGDGGGVDGGVSGELKSDEVEKFKFQQEISLLASNSNTTTCSISLLSSPMVSTPTSNAFSSGISHILGDQEAEREVEKSTVFINGMAIGVPNTPINVKEEFGEDVMLVHSLTGQEVVMNEWGVTLDPLQHGASYYLVGINNNTNHLVAFPLLDKVDTSQDLLASQFPYQI